MNPLRLLVLLVTLPLLLGGCGKKEVPRSKLLQRHGIFYLVNSEKPFTGKSFDLYDNGQKEIEVNWKDGKFDGLFVGWYENGRKSFIRNYKDGKRDGLETTWYENGQKKMEGNWKDGKYDGLFVGWHENGQKEWEGNYKGHRFSEKVEGSVKYWNSKGEPVDSRKEAEAE